MNKQFAVFTLSLLVLIMGCEDDCSATNSCTTLNTYYADLDNDTYGDPLNSTEDESLPLGYVENDLDCNDDVNTGGDINPDADESNTDLVDSNCDGSLGAAPFVIGDYGPAGGMVFYATDFTDSYGVERAGLEASLADQDGGSGAAWGCYPVSIDGSNGTAIGTGEENTSDMMLADCLPSGSPAAFLVSTFVKNGYDDWFLPSKNELFELNQKRGLVGGFTSNKYWSSSEVSEDFAWEQNFGNGDQRYDAGKQYPLRVRAIRAF